MSGSAILSEAEKAEMLQDATDVSRGRAFEAARRRSHEGSLDDYIEFLSQNMEFVESDPVKKTTVDFKL
jgi:hypothetical protein